MSREQDTVAPAIDRDTAETGRMRLRGVVDEAWRDIVSGTSHAFMLMLILAALVGGLSAADLFSIRSIAQQVDRYIASGASTYVIEFKGRISGEACERLSSVDGVLASGALRSRNDKVTSAVLPSAGIPSLDATTGGAWRLRLLDTVQWGDVDCTGLRRHLAVFASRAVCARSGGEPARIACWRQGARRRGVPIPG